MNAKRPSKRAVRLVGRVRAAIDRGAEAAESIHKRAAKLPLAPFEGIDALEGAVRDLHRLQDRSIGAVYDLVRSVNHELGRLAEQWLVEGEPAPKRRRARKHAHAAAAHAAA
jgi:hypothetical protein